MVHSKNIDQKQSVSNTEENALPLVTIFTLSYNTGKYVVKAIQSIRDQTYPQNRIQHIIIDDHSTDGSSELVENWIKENRYDCIFIKHQENRGICKSLNEIQQLAKGKYITGVCDDLWLPGKLENQVSLMETFSEKVAILYGDCYVVDENDKIIHDSYLRYRRRDPESMPEGIVFEQILRSNFMPTPTLLMRKQSIDEVGGYDESLFYEDVDMGLKLTRTHEVKYSKYKGVKYRIRSNSLSNSQVKDLRLVKSKIKSYMNWVDDEAYGELAAKLTSQLCIGFYARDKSLGKIYINELIQKKRKVLFYFFNFLMQMKIGSKHLYRINGLLVRLGMMEKFDR